MIEVIFGEDDFTLCKEYGIGMSDTPWEGLIVKSSDAAEKHVVEVNEQNFDKYQKFFKSKYNVTLKPLTEPTVEPKVEPIVIKATANE